MIKTMSASSITCYEQCPKMFQYEYIDRVMGLPSDALIIGEMVHLALKHFHEKRDPYLEVKKKLLNPISEEGIKKFGMIRKMVDNYIKDPIKAENVALEKKFRIPLRYNKEVLKVPLTGIIDRLTLDGVIEYKTSQKDYTQEEVDKHLQGTIYSLAFYQLRKQIKPVIFCVLNKISGRVQKLKTERVKSDFENLFSRVYQIYNLIEQNKFDSTPGNQCYWCAFRLECPDKLKNYERKTT